MTHDEIDKKVEEWHAGPSTGMPLHAYVGMTLDEWKDYVETGEIVDSRCPLGHRCTAGDIAICKDFWHKCAETKLCQKDK